MADLTKIEWTDATWNPVTGCSIVDAGCTNCYAMGLAGSRLRNHPSRAGLTRVTGGRAKWTGEVRLNEQWLDQPLRWSRARMIFVCAHGDLFHEAVPDEWIDRVFAVMALAPQHTFQVLTKRPERMQMYLITACGRIADAAMKLRHSDIAKRIGMGPSVICPLPHIAPGKSWWPLPNVWLGTSISDQASADLRIPHLLDAPAAVRFLSAEPLLEALSLIDRDPIKLATGINAKPEHRVYVSLLRGWGMGPYKRPGLDWVIVGGESGPHARPMHPDWARSLRDQCVAAGVPFFFKQWGNHAWCETVAGIPSTMTAYRVSKAHAGRLLDGRTWDQMPGVQHG